MALIFYLLFYAICLTLCLFSGCLSCSLYIYIYVCVCVSIRIVDAHHARTTYILRNYCTSVRAAHAALCAQEQHKYWEMRDLLFQVSLDEKLRRKQAENEGNGESARVPMTFDSLLLKRLASLSGLDAISFAKCLHSERHVDEVKRLNKLAHTLGVRGTPYFVFDRSSERRNKFQDLHTHREGVVSQEEVRRLLRLDENE